MLEIANRMQKATQKAVVQTEVTFAAILKLVHGMFLACGIWSVMGLL